MTTTITAIVSPWTGETITVIPNAEHAEAMGHPLDERHGHGTRPPGSVLTLQTARRILLRTLWEHGPFADTSGRATAKLHAAMCARGYRSEQIAVTAVMGGMGTAIDRQTNAKRTFRIALGLVPEHWAKYLADLPGPPAEPLVTPSAEPSPEPVTEWQAQIAESFAVDQRARVAVEAATESPEPLSESGGSDDGSGTLHALTPSVEVAGVVAMELLTRVVEIISTGTPPDRASMALRAERDDARQRLSEALSYGETLRSTIRRLERERDTQASVAAAMRSERDGLRERLRSTEANLTAALRGEAAQFVTGEVAKAIDRVMRVNESPKVSGAA